MDKRIKGYAFTSDDGMVADALGEVPDSFLFSADRDFIRRELEAADVVVCGRGSAWLAPILGLRPRLIVTRQVERFAPTAGQNALLWNPERASFDEAIAALEGPSAVVAVLGGTCVHDLFLDRYDAFHLSRSPTCWLPGGRPIFSGVPARSPDDILAAHGLTRYPHRTGYATVSETLGCWRRQRLPVVSPARPAAASSG